MAFDIHEHREGLKQLRDSGTTQLFANRGEIKCPACGQTFRRLFWTTESTTTFPEHDGRRFCLLQTERAVLVFRH